MGVNKDVKETVIWRDNVGVTRVSRKRDYYLSINYQVLYNKVPILFIELSVLLLIELRVLREDFVRLDLLMSRSLVIVDVLLLRLWPYCLNKLL